MNFLLYMLSFLFRCVVNLRTLLYKNNFFKKKQFKIPIISIGNISVGGTGKTPMTIYLSQCLKKQNIQHAIVTRGYKKKGRGTLIVQDYKKQHIIDPVIVGDEPIVLSHKLFNVPIIVDSNKLRGIRFAIKKFNPKMILIDDGFQSHYIIKNHDLVLIDNSLSKNKYRLMPLGILREPVKMLKRATFVLFVNKGTINPKIKKLILPIIAKYNIPNLDATFQSQIYKHDQKLQKLTIYTKKKHISKPVIALSGIGSPDSFISLINIYCENIIGQYHFPDHFQYSPKNKKIKKILKNIHQSQKNNLSICIITTLKDYIKIKLLREFQLPFLDIYVLDINIIIEDEKKLLTSILESQ